jgi:hypothetical protein
MESTNSGTLLISNGNIIWAGKENQSSDSTAKIALSVPAESASYYTFGLANNDDEQSVLENIKQIPSRRVFPINDDQSVTKKETYFFMFSYNDETFKFYPLGLTEVKGLTKVMKSVTGTIPMQDDEYVRKTFGKHLEKRRNVLLSQLLEETDPWIRTSVTLNLLIKRLTTEHQPQRLIDMERLYHSCRLEQEVTLEATSLLNNLWDEIKSDHTRIKVWQYLLS